MDKQQGSEAVQAAQATEAAEAVALMDKQQAAEAAGARPLFTDGRCYVPQDSAAY